MRVRKIDSPKNLSIKFFSKLKDKKWRKKSNLFLVEGEREVKRAIEAGFKPSTIIVQDGNFVPIYENTAREINVDEFIIVSKSCAEKISIRENPSEVFGIFSYPRVKDINQVKFEKINICLCILWVEKPGNIGAILRSAEAFGVDIILVSQETDIFNPHIIRNSTGAVFNLNIVHTDEKRCIDFLKNFWVVSADPNAKSVLWEIQPKFPIALIVGAEDKGIPENFKRISNQIVKIPMLGKVDSLNVSISSALILYEVMKMRMSLNK